MSKKCKWKDGSFVACDEMWISLYQIKNKPMPQNVIDEYIDVVEKYYQHCPYCYEPLKKPAEGFNQDGTPKEEN